MTQILRATAMALALMTAQACSTQASQVAPLSAYDGLYPFDRQPGLAFLDHPAVSKALGDVDLPPVVRRSILESRGPTTPLWIDNGRIHSWGCEAHLCGSHNWTLSMTLAGEQPEVCYHDTNRQAKGALWFSAGGTEARTNECPSESLTK